LIFIDVGNIWAAVQGLEACQSIGFSLQLSPFPNRVNDYVLTKSDLFSFPVKDMRSLRSGYE